MALKGLSAIVTGGSSGLGLATVKKLIAHGCKVLICDIQKSTQLEELNGEYLFSNTDVSSESDAMSAIDITRKEFKRLDILVNCAGIGLACKTYNTKYKKPHPLDTFEKVMKINAVGTFNMIRLAATVMVENEPNEDNLRGVIINTASVAAFEGQVGQAAYAASKAAIVGMTLPIARDLGREGIRVMSIAPGLFSTQTITGERGFRDDTLEYLSDVQLAVSRLGHADEFSSLIVSAIENCMLNGFFETPLLAGLPSSAHLVKHTVCPQRLGMPEEFASLVLEVIRNPMLNGDVIRLDAGARMPP